MIAVLLILIGVLCEVYYRLQQAADARVLARPPVDIGAWLAARKAGSDGEWGA